MLRALRFVCLMLTALSAGMSFCHLLELPPRMFVFDAGLWIATSTNGLYYLFGTVGAAIEVGSVLSAVALAYVVRGRGPTSPPTLAAAALVALALGLWFALIAPVNAELAGWTPSAYPRDWTGYRDQWELSHALNAVLKIIALGLLLWSVLLEISDTVGERHPSRRNGNSLRRAVVMPAQFKRVK